MGKSGIEEVDKAVEMKDRYLLEHLKELIKIPTFVPPGENYGEIVDFLLPIFEDLGFECERIEMPEDVYEERQKSEGLKGERVNLLATKDSCAEKSVVIYTHLDVVPAGEGWDKDTPPFDAVVKGNRIYGRGVADSKGAVASLLTALRVMKEQELESKYNLRIALTTDEEIGPYSGLCYFADEGFLSGDYFLCMDGDNEGICVATNGVINWEITVYGKSCHSSTPFLGVNAIEKAALVMNELEELKRRIERKESKAPCSPVIAEKTECKHMKPVFNVTMINAGVKENIIPGSCTLRGDRRYIPEENSVEVIKEFEDSLEKIKRKHSIELKWRCKEGYPPMFTDSSTEWVKEVKEKASDAFGILKEIIGVQGSLDVAYAIQRTNQSVCSFGVGSSLECNAHGANENVRIRDLKNYVKFLLRLLA